VTPVPDPRLAKDATFTLAESLTSDTTAILVTESTQNMSTITGFFVRNSVTIQIDDELIIYKGISKEQPYAFTNCQRGAYSTKVASHKAGAKVHHLKECFGLFVPDPDSTLLEDVAASASNMYNECGFDMMYLDALDGEDILGGGENSWHYGSKFVFELWKRLKKPAIMEMSTYGLYGNPAGLKEISLNSGAYIIAGTGFYLEQTFSDEIKNMSIDQMVAVMLRDIYEGFPGSDVRAGVIGEVGITPPNIQGSEERSLRAAARVQHETGLSMNVHIGFSIDLSRQAVQILREEKADFKKISFAHCDGNRPEVNRELTELGVYVECDCFGNEFYVDNGAYDGDNPWYFGSDGDRIRSVKALVDAGLGDRLFFSQDVCSKMQTVQYGGYGYAHLLENILPMLEHIGVSRQVLWQIMTENPLRFLLGE
jgi:phosphotriesterase-related protein